MVFVAGLVLLWCLVFGLYTAYYSYVWACVFVLCVHNYLNTLQSVLCVWCVGVLICGVMLIWDCVVIGLLLALLYCGSLIVWQGFATSL